jgi:hypothetical protein
MLTILTIAVLHTNPTILAQEWDAIPKSTAEMDLNLEEPAEQQVPNEATAKDKAMEQRERTFYKYGEEKKVAPPTPEPSPSAQVVDEQEIPASSGETSESQVITIAPDKPAPEQPEPLPLADEELLVPGASVPVTVEGASWLSKSYVIPLIFGVLAVIAYCIWRMLPRFRTTMSKEAIAPPPAHPGTYDTSAMVRLKTAMEDEKSQ